MSYNPDTRPLPYGWKSVFDPNYQQWFYVDTNVNPPRRQWEHPEGVHDQFMPPPGPPPFRSVSPYGGPPPPANYGQPQGGYGGQPQGGYGGPSQGGYGGGYEPSYGRGQSPGPAVPYGSRPQYGDESRGFFGGGSPLPQQNVTVVEEKPKHHWGLGTKIAAGGAGILGGLLVADGIEHLVDRHDEYEQQVGFQEGEQAGFQQGDAVGFQQGDQFGFQQGDQVGFEQGDQVGFDQGYVDGSIDDGW